MDPREKKLPAWACQLIESLRERLRIANEPLIQEVSRLRPQMETLKRHNAALTELLECAARGGHKTAAEIVDIIHTYDLILDEKEY